MSVRVSAVIISHDQPEWLKKTLLALESQTRRVNEIIAVDSSTGSECASVLAEFQIDKVVRRNDSSFSALVAAGVSQVSSAFSPETVGVATSAGKLSEQETQVSWLWLLHDDSVPDPDALEKLLAAADLSPSVALLGPKQVDPKQKNLIVQQGMTLTKLGGIFSLVENELDQSQHDQADDVMAVSSAGALIRSDLYRRLQGFDRQAPNFASDIDFSIRARLAGYRVVVVPQAKIAHATLSLKGQRPRRWLKGNVFLAKRRAEVHLNLAYLPLATVWAYLVFLPLIGISRALYRIAAKQPRLVAGELRSAFWGFFSSPVRLLSRSKISATSDVGFSSLNGLRASWSMVRYRNRMLQDHVADDLVVSDSEVSASSSKNSVSNSFTAAGGWWFAFGLLISSWQFWPTNVAAVGGSFAPLGGDWLALAGRAGASWQSSGLGMSAPSDPFNWLLTAAGAFWFATPSLALGTLVLLARTIAFAGSWRASGIVTNRAWLRNLIGLAYAIWPSIVAAQNQARIGAIFCWMLLPWLVFALSKVSSSERASRVRSKLATWVGISGLLFAAVAVSAPSVALILVVAILVMICVRPKRIAVFASIPALAATLYAPYVWFMAVGLGHPIAIFSDPGLPIDSHRQSFWQVLLSVPNGLRVSSDSMWSLVSLWPALVLLLALLSLFSRRPLLAAALICFGALATAVGFLAQQTYFASLEVHGSSAPATAVAALTFLLAAGLALDALEPVRGKFLGVAGIALTTLTFVVALASFGFYGAGFSRKPAAIAFTDGRTLPAIAEAEAAQGSPLRLLKISQVGQNRFDSQLISPGGLLLEANSTAYRSALAQRSRADARYADLNALVANLVSANGTDLTPALNQANIGFVLVPNKSASDLNASLNSVSELDSVGQTEFGWLWRVKRTSIAGTSQVSWQQSWSITKGVQLSVILIFLLLAIPGSPKRRAKNVGNIFISNDFEAPDFETPDFETPSFEADASASLSDRERG